MPRRRSSPFAESESGRLCSRGYQQQVIKRFGLLRQYLFRGIPVSKSNQRLGESGFFQPCCESGAKFLRGLLGFRDPEKGNRGIEPAGQRSRRVQKLARGSRSRIAYQQSKGRQIGRASCRERVE